MVDSIAYPCGSAIRVTRWEFVPMVTTDNGTAEKIDVRSLAVDGVDAFAKLDYDALAKSGTPFYFANPEWSETDRGELLKWDTYNIDGELMGKILIARRAVLEKVKELQAHYPSAGVFGPFTFTREKMDGTMSKTYMLTPYKTPAK